MIDSRVALDMDRLPWLADERTEVRAPRPKPRRNVSWVSLVPWALVAILLVAGVSYWLGMRSMSEPDFVEQAAPTPSVATTTLPAPVIERVEPVVMPEVKPVDEPAPVRIAPAKSVGKASTEVARRAAAKPAAEKAEATLETAETEAAPKPAKLEYWPAIESTGASGRMVRIGTFSSRHQAKKGWWAIVRHYPGMSNLKAVVAPVPSRRNGKTYYRLQFGTTSQAHSAILCQRMRMIAQSCVVVGLPQGQGSKAK